MSLVKKFRGMLDVLSGRRYRAKVRADMSAFFEHALAEHQKVCPAYPDKCEGEMHVLRAHQLIEEIFGD